MPVTARYNRPGSTTAWRKLRAQVLTRDGWICQSCGVPVHPRCGPNGCGQDACAAHITAKADGGLDTPANVRASCRDCNIRGPMQRTPPTHPLPKW